jgi:AraC-like DNA-binding protein
VLVFKQNKGLIGQKKDMQKHLIYFNELNPHVRYVNLLQCSPGFSDCLRRIYDHQMVYVHKGKGRIKIGEKMYTAKTGDVFFYGPGVSHSFYADEVDPYLLTGFHFDFTSHYKTLLFPIGPFATHLYKGELATETIEFADFIGFPEHINLSAHTRLRELIFEMLKEFEEGKIYNEGYINSLFHAFLIIISRNVLIREVDPNSKDEVVNQVIRFIQDHFTESLTNECIAARFHFHQNYLNQLMVAHTGVPIRQYLIDFRIRKALDMLLNTRFSIIEIAKKVGYEDSHYFSRVFKKKTGLTPAQVKSGIL